MNIRNRIKGLREVKASELAPHPKNWRVHPEGQRNVLRGLLAELGVVVPIVCRELSDGSLQIIDGHCRAEEIGDGKVTVVVTDLSEEEARKALATIDPVSDLADKDQAILDDLLAGVESDNDAVGAMLETMLSREAKLQDDLPGNNIGDIYQGMPEFQADDQLAKYSLKVNFDCVEDLQAFARVVGQPVTEKTRSIWYPYKERLPGREFVAEDSPEDEDTGDDES